MSDQLSMFSPETCADTGSAISSPESGSGATPSASLDGRTIDPSGPPPARASRSPRRASARGQRIIATFGPSCFDSSKDAALSLRLANRLQAKTASLGSTLFELTWTNAATPAGAWCPRLAATARPIAVSGCIGVPWPTTATRDWKSGETGGDPLEHNARPLSEAALLAAWNTPRATDGSHGGPNQAGGALSADVALMGWPTNRSVETGHSTGNPSRAMDCKARIEDVVYLAGWSTATVNDARAGCNATANRNPEAKRQHPGFTLVDLAKLTGWATCKASDGEGGRTTITAGGGNAHLSIQARLAAHGPERTGFCVGPSGWEILPASGQLNPGLSRWLMGLPPAFCDSAVTAMQSLPRRPRRSLKP